ncbi:hypothetical protein H9P43_009161 [Blastocladiella emersonii ATCC 22665]|nr:hypothetical protein H9P43_009161 [Blastocladiella emersonii ATCC 22665]
MNISAHDSSILDLIFSPGAHGAPAPAPPKPDPARPSPSAQAIAALDPATASEMRRLEARGIELAETAADTPAAIAAFTSALALCPANASVLNNRAQAYRLLGDLDAALADLNAAIAHGAGDSFVLKQAHTQRAVVYKSLAQPDQSLADFEAAARHGNEIARIAAVKENPIAQLCNAMVTDLMAQYHAPPPSAAEGEKKN